jgi:FkbM family methyltransferase
MSLKDALGRITPRPLYERIDFLVQLRRAMLPFRPDGVRLIRERLLPAGARVFDVGANVGRFSREAARAAGPEGRVWAFEPMPEALGILRANLRLGRLQSRVSVLPCAVAEAPGRSRMVLPLKGGWKPTTQTAHLLHGQPPPAAGVEVEVIQLDTFAEQQGIGRLDLIKCDVEGFELFVFQGARRILDELRPAVFCEVEHPYLERNGVAPQAIFELFAARGYRAFRPLREPALVPLEGYSGRGNYFFLHTERHAALIAETVSA